MKVFKIMGVYLLAAIVFTACSKDNSTENSENLDANKTLAVRASADFNYGYYQAALDLQADFEARGGAELPLTADSWEYYKSVLGADFDLDVDTVNAIIERSAIIGEVGLKDYLNDYLGVKEDTKNFAMTIAEDGPIKGLERDARFNSLPEKEQLMLLGANAVALDFAKNSRMMTTPGSSRFFFYITSVIGAIGGVMTGVAVGDDLCGWPCAVVGGIVGGIIGWFAGGAGGKL